MEISDKIIFLDVDGVMNSQRHAYRNYKAGINDLLMRRFDPIAVRELNRVIRRTDADIVISSTWRMTHSGDELKAHFTKQGFEYSHKMIGKTPVFHKERGEEIQYWLDKKEFKGKFVILDDDSDMLHLMPYLVQTKFRYGLTIKKATEVIRRLI